MERDYIFCATPEKLPVGRDFIVCSTELHRPMHAAFSVQRGQAKGRGIDFKLTFDQWASVWLEGEKWGGRGTRADQYAMGRLGDLGAYETGNVKIITVAQNGFEAQGGRKASNETRAKQSAAHLGKKFTDEHRANLSAARQRNLGAIRRPTDLNGE